MKNISLEAALLSLQNEKECREFLNDLCSEKELEVMRERWEIVLLLSNDGSYREISQKLKTSTTTVTRVAKCLRRVGSGYQSVLNKL